MIELHEKLRQDCHVVGRFRLCQLLLMKDANYPWCILVPDRDNIREIHQLNKSDQLQLMRESSILSAFLETAFDADKINIAAIGNIVPQLHIHHVVRYRNDRSWPAPVWGASSATPYTEAGLQRMIDKLKAGLSAELEYPV